jgi:CRISPR-associated exonuclease Cas4
MGVCWDKIENIALLSPHASRFMGVRLMIDDDLDYLPLSYLNQLEYCERRFWLMFVEGEIAVNAPMLEGIYRHEHAHDRGSEQRGELMTYRQVYVWSERLRLAGLADFVEDNAAEYPKGYDAGQLLPVEHKRGKIGRWLNDHIQLCAQAMCLEERTGRPIDSGEIFYWANRRRERVDFTPELRALTETAVQRAWALLAAGQLPPPTPVRAKCRDCSLEPICLPKEVSRLVG